MRRWHSERNLMLRRWRHEIAIHGGHDGWQLPPFTSGVGLAAPLPPLTCDAPPCHCFAGPNFFRKRKPLDCGRPRCGTCHYEKFYVGKDRYNKRREAIDFDLRASL